MTEGVSVVLSYYNGERYFKAQFESIIRQLGEEDELIIRDDGSEAEEMLIKSCLESELGRNLYEQGQLRIYSGVNLGVNQSFLKLLDMAKNEVTVFCDQDDEWTDCRLDSVRTHYCSDLHYVNYSIAGQVQLDKNRTLRALSVFLRNRVPGCCMSGRTEYLRSVISSLTNELMYDHALLFLSLLRKAKVTFDPKVGVLYRRHEDTVTKYGAFVPDGILTALQRRLALIKSMRTLAK